MITPREILAQHCIPSGGHKSVYVTTCPQCSHARHKKREKCLSVLIDGRGVRWNCHHCGWNGWQFYDEPHKPDRKVDPFAFLKPSSIEREGVDNDRERNRQKAAKIWRETVPLLSTLGERYFIEHRSIDIAGINLKHVLRWHAADRMIVARMTDAVTNQSTGVHRTYLDPSGAKLGRKMLGPAGVIRLWPDEAVANGLVIGEGIETTLAAALGMELHGTLLQPAWALGSANAIRSFPVVPGIETLTILADNDESHTGQSAGVECARRWQKAGRHVILLVPRTVKDFNDLIREAV